MLQKSIDIVLPLGNGSKYCNFELRMALRSIGKYALNIRKIYLIGDDIPSWVRNVQIIGIKDRHIHNKDANLIEKLLAAVATEDLSEKFIFWSDDQLALRRFCAGALMPVYNRRGRAAFQSGRIWHERMRRTFDYLQQHNKNISCNWDSHVPQIMEKSQFARIMRQIDYISEPGYCINTLYFGMAGTLPLLEQSRVKVTLERKIFLDSLPENKLFLGYNNESLQGNLAGLLLERFPEPCVFEKEFSGPICERKAIFS